MRILHNGNIYTQDPKHAIAEAIAIENGLVVAVGSNEQILQNKKSGDQVTNLKGKTILPGLTDAHIHLEQYGFSLQKIDCETGTLHECLERVAQKARKTPPGHWILGHGWNQNTWKEGFGTAQDLDRVAPDNPVYLTTKSLHAGWANSAALKIAGITSQSPNPPDGIIAKQENGEPSGILFESAMGLLDRIIPPPSHRRYCCGLETCAGKPLENGYYWSA